MMASGSGSDGSLDQTRVSAAVRGDRDALAELLNELAPQVWQIARRLMGNDHDAADASQEALIALSRGITGFDGRSSVRTWAHRVATNACLDELRRRGRRPMPADDALLADVADPAASQPDLLVDLDGALASLTPEHRAVVVLRDVMGHDYETIAHLLDVPIGTVRSRLARARGALLRVLEPAVDDHGLATEPRNFSPPPTVEPTEHAPHPQPPRTP